MGYQVGWEEMAPVHADEGISRHQGSSTVGSNYKARLTSTGQANITLLYPCSQTSTGAVTLHQPRLFTDWLVHWEMDIPMV